MFVLTKLSYFRASTFVASRTSVSRRRRIDAEYEPLQPNFIRVRVEKGKPFERKGRKAAGLKEHLGRLGCQRDDSIPGYFLVEIAYLLLPLSTKTIEGSP